MKFSKLIDQEWNNTPLKKRFLKQNKKVKNEDDEYLLNVSSREGIEQLDTKRDQFLDSDRILKELERFDSPRSGLNSYAYVVIKFGVLKYLCQCPDFSAPKEKVIEEVREWESRILDSQALKQNEYDSNELTNLARAASEYEGEILEPELNLIYRYMKENNEEIQYEINKIWWEDLFDRLSFLKKFPKLADQNPHGFDPVETGIWALEDQAILYEIKNNKSEDIVGLPEEFVPIIKEWLHFELSENDMNKLFRELDEMKRGTLDNVMKTCNLVSATDNDERIRKIVQSKILPSEALDIALNREQLKSIVDQYRVDISKNKSNKDMAEAIVSSYLNWGIEDEEIGWEHPQYLQYYSDLGGLNGDVPAFTDRLEGELKKSRIENIFDKEFETATFEIFKEIFNLDNVGLLGHTKSGERVPDGKINWGDDLILWENKATDTKYNMSSDHELRFQEYIDEYQNEDSNVELFLLISNDFTKETHGRISQNFINSKEYHTKFCLIKARDFEKLAKFWRDHFLNEDEEATFPLKALNNEGLIEFDTAKKNVKRYA